MKISQDTIAIMRHYAAINPGLIVDEGNRIYTRAINKTIRSTAVIPDEFPVSFAVANLAQFLNTISFFNDPDMEFTEENVTIQNSDGSQKVVYYFSDSRLVEQDNKMLKAAVSEDVKFHITAEELARLNKASSVMGLPDVCVFNRDGEIIISCTNKSVSTSSAFEFHVGVYDGTSDFKCYFKKSNLKLTDNEYDVVISSRGISIWTATNTNLNELVYYVTLESDMTFDANNTENE